MISCFRVITPNQRKVFPTAPSGHGIISPNLKLSTVPTRATFTRSGIASTVDTLIALPKSSLEDVVWPALPNRADAVVLALNYQMEHSQWLDPEILAQTQFKQLELLLAHAAKTAPFYRDRLRMMAGTRRGQLTPDLWRRIPVLRRAEIQENRPALLSRHLPKNHGATFEISTSGSTGRPVTITGTAVTQLFFTALNLRYHLWHRRDLLAKIAGICVQTGAITAALKDGKGESWAPVYDTGPFVFMPIATPVGKQLEWLGRENPGYLLTYPSNLMALVKRSQESGVRLEGLRGVATMGEVLGPDVRSACETIWAVPVTDAYSAQEVGMIALQCPDHPHYHVQSENVLVEVLDDAGEPCAPGQVGRLVITDLHNFAMPMIRYEIGDFAEVGAPCPCGRGLPVLRQVMGRVRNMLTLPSGDQVWPQWHSDELTGMVAAVRQVQLVQHSLDDIEVNVAVTRPLTRDEEETLRHAILERLYHRFPLRFTYVEKIPRAANGKYEEFSSRLGT